MRYWLTALTLVGVGYGHKHPGHYGDNSLRVETRTGTFLGDLNDTYPDVRQFKYVPYAKVGTIKPVSNLMQS